MAIWIHWKLSHDKHQEMVDIIITSLCKWVCNKEKYLSIINHKETKREGPTSEFMLGLPKVNEGRCWSYEP